MFVEMVRVMRRRAWGVVGDKHNDYPNSQANLTEGHLVQRDAQPGYEEHQRVVDSHEERPGRLTEALLQGAVGVSGGRLLDHANKGVPRLHSVVKQQGGTCPLSKNSPFGAGFPHPTVIYLPNHSARTFCASVARHWTSRLSVIAMS